MKQIKVLVLCSPSTTSAGAYNLWKGLSPLLLEQGIRLVILSGNESDEIVNPSLQIRYRHLSWVRRSLANIVADVSPDLLITSISQSDILVGFSRALRRKIPWTIGILGVPFPIAGIGVNRLKRWTWESLWRLAFRHCSSYFTISAELGSRLFRRRLPLKPTATLYPAVEPLSNFQPKRSTTPKNIGFVGRLSREKNPNLYCQMSLLANGLTFHVFGDGPERRSLVRDFSEVVFHGFAPKAEIYKDIDILALTSKTEGSPLVILEASLMGVLPVVADVGGCMALIAPPLREILVMPSSSPAEEWAKRVQEVSEAKGFQSWVQIQHQYVVQEFGSQKVANDFARFIRKTVSEGKCS